MVSRKKALIQQLVKGKALILYQTYAELRAETEKTYAGFLWWIIEPIMSMAVYYIVFKLILHRGTDNFVIFLFIGLVPFRWLATTLMHGSNAIINAQSLMQQVYVHKVVFVITSFLTDTIKFIVVFIVLLIFVWVSGFPVGFYYFALPLVLIVQAILVLAVTTLFSGITPFLPDIRMVLENIVRLWLFLSGVFYPISTMSERGQFIFRLNPMTVIIESYRDILMLSKWPDLSRLGLIGLSSCLLCVIALAIINRNDYIYPKLAN